MSNATAKDSFEIKVLHRLNSLMRIMTLSHELFWICHSYNNTLINTYLSYDASELMMVLWRAFRACLDELFSICEEMEFTVRTGGEDK